MLSALLLFTSTVSYASIQLPNLPLTEYSAKLFVADFGALFSHDGRVEGSNFASDFDAIYDDNIVSCYSHDVCAVGKGQVISNYQQHKAYMMAKWLTFNFDDTFLSFTPYSVTVERKGTVTASFVESMPVLNGVYPFLNKYTVVFSEESGKISEFSVDDTANTAIAMFTGSFSRLFLEMKSRGKAKRKAAKLSGLVDIDVDANGIISEELLFGLVNKDFAVFVSFISSSIVLLMFTISICCKIGVYFHTKDRYYKVKHADDY